MAKNSKVGHFRGNNSYKGSPYNFIQMKTFDKLDLRIISASKSFEKGSEEDDYFNKFPPTMPSVVLENRSIRMFKVSYRSAPK
jgi:hypothetical protein